MASRESIGSSTPQGTHVFRREGGQDAPTGATARFTSRRASTTLLQVTSTPPRRSEALASAGALLGLVVLAVISHRDVVFEARVYQYLDALSLSLPQRAFMVSELSQGRFPLWNPFEAFGTPFFAQLVPGVLHPLNLVYAVLPLGRAFAWNYVLASAWAACGVWGVVRWRGGSRWAAFIAAAAFGCSGPLVTQTNLQYLVGAASVPWALAGLDLVQRRATPGALLVGASAIALVVFAGEPQALLMAFAFGVADVAAGACGPWKKAGARLALLGLCGGVLAAVQLWPSVEALQHSGRLHADFGAWEQWSLHPLRLFEFVTPRLFFEGSEPFAATDPYWLLISKGHPLVWTPSVFLGGAVVLLAAQGVGASARTRALAGFGALACWASLGPAFGLSRWLGWLVPLWRSFRYTEKLVPFVFLALVLLAAEGLDRLRVEGRVDRVVWAACGGLLVVPVLAAVGRVATGAELSGFAAHGLRQSLWGVVPTVGALFALARPGRPGSLRVGWLSLCVVAPVVAWSSFPTLAMSEAAALTEPWVLGPLRTEVSAAPPRVVTWFDPSIERPERVSGRPLVRTAINLQFGVDVAGPNYYPFAPAGFERLVTHSRMSESVAQRFGVGFAFFKGASLARQRPLWRDFTERWEPIAEHPSSELDIVVARAKRSLPRAYVALEAEQVADQPAALARVTRPDAPLDQRIVVECEVPAGGAAQGQAVISTWAPDAVTVRARASADTFVVLNDAWYPGWHAFVDGVEAPICRANGYVRAVRVGAGDHVVEFQYAPDSFVRGLAVSVGGALVLLLRELRRRRAEPA